MYTNTLFIESPYPAAGGTISPKIMEKRHSLLCRSTLYLYLYCIYFVLLYLQSTCVNKMSVWFTILFHLKTMTATTFNTYQVWECLRGSPTSVDHNMTAPNFKSSSIQPEKSTDHWESGSYVLAVWHHQNLCRIALKTRNKNAPGINLWISYRGWVWHGKCFHKLKKKHEINLHCGGGDIDNTKFDNSRTSSFYFSSIDKNTIYYTWQKVNVWGNCLTLIKQSTCDVLHARRWWTNWHTHTYTRIGEL